MADLISGGLAVLMIGSLVVVERRLKEKVSLKDAEEKFVNRTVCMTLHKSIDEKLAMIPKINEVVIRIDQTLIDQNLKNKKNG